MDKNSRLRDARRFVEALRERIELPEFDALCLLAATGEMGWAEDDAHRFVDRKTGVT